MSIELSGAAHTPKAAGSSGGAHGRDAARAGGDAGNPLAGGFLSLLSAFEVDAGGVTGVNDQVGADPVGGGGLPALAGEKQPVSESLEVDPAVLPNGLAVPLPSDPALLLAQGLQSVGSGAQALPGAVVKAEAGGLSVDSARSIPGGGRPATTAVGALGARVGGPAAAMGPPAQPESTMQSPGEFFKKAPKPQSGNALVAKSGEAATGAGPVVADWRELKPTSIAEVVSRNPSLAEAVVATGSNEAGNRPLERSSGKSGARQIGGSVEGAWGAQALLTGGRIDAPAAMAEALMLPPEVSVAEQVKYWIASDVQNAELKLDGFGADPVEVSISLQGNEAHVAFRSDHSETRLVLENAVSHLRGLLASEGLVLSGVSVGASGQHGSGAQEERRGRTGERQTMVATLEPVPVVGGQHAGLSSGRTVDLFV